MLDLPDNITLPFQLESSHLRGRLVHMGGVLDTILDQHDYPQIVGHLLAEAIVIAVALASSLKYDGVFTLQAKGDGIVGMLVADVTSDGGIRAYAQFDKDKVLAAPALTGATGKGPLGKGYLAFTCSLTGNEERYQGIVELQGESLAEAVQHYFRQSEQVPTGILAATARGEDGHWRGGCLLLQRMPREGGINVESDTPEAEDWTRAMMVMGTCTSLELTDRTLAPETLLFRLFHEEGVRVFDAHDLRAQCRCSLSRVEGMLKSLPRAEIEDLAVDDLVNVTCEFCNKTYPFDRQARDRLFSEESAP